MKAPVPRSLRATALALLAALAALILIAGAMATTASADVIWRLGSASAPTDLSPGGRAQVIASASNIGQSAVLGAGAQPVVISDRLPAGLEIPSMVTAAEVVGRLEANDRSEAASELVCAIEEAQRKEVSCKTTPTTQPLAPYTQLRVTIPAEVLPGASSGEQNTVSVRGGELAGGLQPTPPAPRSAAIQVTGQPTGLGVEGYEISPEEQDGSSDPRAGSHPYQLTTTLDLNKTLAREGPAQPELEPTAPALARELSFELPPGLLGDPQAVAQCTDTEFASVGENNANSCPADSAIGVALVTLNLPSPPLGVFTEAVPVFNLVPAPGEPARFGLEDTKVPIILDTQVRTSGDYGVTVAVHNTTQLGGLLDTQVVLWGEPENPSHNSSRGWACLHAKEINGEQCETPTGPAPPAFLTLPTSCTGSLASAMSVQAWNGETTQQTYTFQTGLGEALTSLQACGSLPFAPSIAVQPVEEHEGATPDAIQSSASTPTGLNVAVSLPLESEGLAESAVRSTTVTLPAGMQLNPSAANGLQACTEAQAGYEGAEPGPDPLAPGAPEPPRFTPAPVTCPQASKVGLARVKSPDLAHELEGGVYIAEQNNNPFGSLFALYLVVEDPASGIRVKLAGEVQLNEETGQATTTFTNTPQVPFESLKLHFFEGPRASLSTPPRCGTYSTLASFAPWSSPTPVSRAATFGITSGPDGAGCSDPEPFAPVLQAGSTSTQAGAFTRFTLTIAHRDGDQALRTLTVQLPPGIAAILASVTPCPEPRAAEERCGPESEIGHSLAESGLGSEPVGLPGTAYLTGPYEGAPFGIEVVTPAVAGPFNLGDVTVRSRINVDPHTAQVTITSDPIPTIIKGVPAQIKALNVTVDRPNFEFNPTDCDAMSISGALTGARGATANVSSPFQASNCQALPFKPKLTASTKGQASKANGANFDVKVESKGLGQANIAKVRLQLPKTLPARLTTLQKACTEGAFNTNPASCPEGSVIGQATIHTPVLSNPLSGPAYLVSHGGAAFPDVEFVLQGEGITLVLDGKTQIKNQITYSKFESAPDAPFTVFETVLPAGPHSALTANLPEKAKFNLCSTNLAMPTEIVGQNGAVLKQTTKIALQGCKKVKVSRPLSRAQLLKRALAACRKQHNHSKAGRQACERQVRKRYVAKKAGQKSHKEPSHR